MEPMRVLTADQMARIDEAAGRILELTGMVIDSEPALEALGRFGCRVERPSGRVRFPRAVTRRAVERMQSAYASQRGPERMPVRFSHVRFRRGPHQVHQDFTVSAGGFVPFIYDLEGRRRPANRHDVLCSINMINRLGQIDTSGPPVSDQTIPPAHRPVVMAAELAKHTRKIGGIETFTARDVRFIHEIAQIAAGSEAAFRAAPALVGYAEVRSPLCFDRNMVEVFMEYLRLGVPQTVDSMPCGGTTAPVTAAGILALGAAESIGAMVLAYAVREDAVVGIDLTPSYADMTTGMYRYSGAERCSLLMARVQLLSEHYGCPAGVHGGKTDSCFLNEQTGVEKISSMLAPVLAGAVGIGTVGCLENAVTFSPVQLVIDDALAGYVRRLVRQPLVVDDQALAIELMDAVAPGGNFLAEPHTAGHFRNELLLSPLFRAAPWASARGQPELFDNVRHAEAIARELWQPPEGYALSDEQVRQIDAVVERALAN